MATGRGGLSVRVTPKMKPLIHTSIPPMILLLTWLSSCASTPCVPTVKTVPVEIVKTKYLPIPSDILSACPENPDPLANGLTNGELRRIALQWQNVYGPCLESKLDAVRALQPK